jgi:hypothetical protein
MTAYYCVGLFENELASAFMKLAWARSKAWIVLVSLKQFAAKT